MALLLGVLLFFIAPGKMSPETKLSAKKFYGLNCAHRGLHTEDQTVPENSMSAFIAARDKGYGIEVDVQLSKDGKVIAFHDFDLRRACGVDGLVKNMNWAELSKLSLFNTDETIPLLSGVLDAVGATPVIVELKPIGKNYAELCQKTLDVLRENGQHWCIESFDPRIVAWFKKNAPTVLRGQLSCSPDKFEVITAFASFIFGYLLTNFLSRPHFIAYCVGLHPLTTRLCRLFKPMNMVWTVTPKVGIEHYQSRNDTVIFEYYNPPPRFK